MASKIQSDHRFEEYLEKLEAREKMQKRKKSLKYVLLIAILGTGFMLYQQTDRQAATGSLPEYSAYDLDAQKVKTLFQVDNAEIVISHPMLGLDTISSEEEYRSLMNLVDLMDSGVLTSIGNKSDRAQLTEGASLETFIVDIEGERKVGRQLIFRIENYDPSVLYTLDFGNGVTRRMKERTSYSYPLPGNFTMQLIATSADRGSSIYTKKYGIEPREGTATVAKPVNNIQKLPPIEAINLEKPVITPVKEEVAPEKKETKETKETNRGQMDNLVASAAEGPADPALNVAENSGSKPTFSIEDMIADSQVKVERDPVIFAEKMPHFPGGQLAMRRYLKESIRYPKKASKENTEGIVVVEFVVKSDGNLSDFKVIKGLKNGCNEEALRLVKGMPNWIPGEANGQKVAVFQRVPIAFNNI